MMLSECGGRRAGMGSPMRDTLRCRYRRRDHICQWAAAAAYCQPARMVVAEVRVVKHRDQRMRELEAEVLALELCCT